MTEASSSPHRPPLAQNDTFDARELVGSMSSDGTAALRPGDDDDDDARIDHAPVGTTTVFAASSSSSPNSSSESALISEEDIEDYDNLELDPDTIVQGSTGGELEHSRSMSKSEANIPHPDLLAGPGHARRKSETQARPLSPGSRRKSIQIKLEKTSKKGRYILTADDPDLREILRKGLEREEASQDPSKRSRTIRDYVFTRQFTTFDRQNPLSSESPFHGFFTLFWLAMVLVFLRVSAYNWKQYGNPLGDQAIMKLMFSHDVMVLGLTDGAMCLSTAFCLLLQRAVLKGYLSWTRSGWIIQNIWQTFYLGAAISWTMYREWPWTHTVFIVLHCLVFLMKQHSFAFYNGYLSSVYKRKTMLKSKLSKLRDMRTMETAPNSPESFRPQSARSTALDLPNLPGGIGMKGHRPSMGPRTSTNLGNEVSDVASISSAMESGTPLDHDQMQAFERIILDEIEGLDKELQGKAASKENSYPNNLRWGNLADYICLPTLVYELEYPRQDKIKWAYVAEKTVATFGVLGVMQVISQAYIYPPVAETVRMKEAGVSLQERWEQMPWTISDLTFPLLLEQLLTWYLIWECVLNVLAELTRFADRGFYGDWWNSTSWDQYARDWNRPVHNFLLRHVYHSSISTFHLSKSSATFVTFLLSALVHELLMACMFHKVRGYLFTMQLLQMPLVSLSRTKLLKGRDLLGNVIFWIGLFVGPSVLTSFYLLI
ncbi:hypothetical protein AAFC00_001642 [Neodothiora populina]|uniref:O-acyltransferase n=1 Tax=Neodothiora populina TaxID=2781224 RepID=A0ABR3PPN7_9PEZI